MQSKYTCKFEKFILPSNYFWKKMILTDAKLSCTGSKDKEYR